MEHLGGLTTTSESHVKPSRKEDPSLKLIQTVDSLAVVFSIVQVAGRKGKGGISPDILKELWSNGSDKQMRNAK